MSDPSAPVPTATAPPIPPANDDPFAPSAQPERPSRPLRDIAKGLVFVAVLAAAVLTARMETLPFSDAPNPLHRLSDKEKRAKLREEIRASVWGPAIFIAAYVVTCIVFLPTIVMSILGGAAFGFWPGILYIWIGAVGGAMATFYLSRLLGRDVVRRIAGPWLVWLDARTERHGFLMMLYSRLLGLPYTPVNYAAGVAAVRVRDFFLGTALGILPFTGALTYFGESIVEGAGIDTYLRLGAVVLVMAFLSGLPLAIRYHAARRRARQAKAESLVGGPALGESAGRPGEELPSPAPMPRDFR